MHDLNEELRHEIMEMAEHDLAVRQELVADGSLTKQGYHPRMEALHTRNAARLAAIIEEHGWPGKSLVGEDGARAAWLVAQHAINNPPFMRKCLSLLRKAGQEDEAPLWQAAILEDRIRMYKGRPQVYGTQFQPNKNGELVPYAVENPEGVNNRRKEVGLNSLEERMRELRAELEREAIPIPPDWEEDYERWLRAAGWRR